MVDNFFYHHGIKGQRWGIRRYQNPDGSLTDAGYLRYGYLNKSKVNRIKDGKWTMVDGYTLTDKGFEYVNKNEELIKKAETAISQLEKKSFWQTKVDNSPYTPEIKEEIKKYFKKDKDGNLIIPKGKEFERITGQIEDVDKRRKYVTYLPGDKRQYQAEWDWFVKPGTDPIKEKYEAKKDLKVATGQIVYDELIKKIGNKKVSEYLKDIHYTSLAANLVAQDYKETLVKDILNNQSSLEKYDIYTKTDRNTPLEKLVVEQYVRHRADVGKSICKEIIAKELFKNQATQDEITKSLSKKGYDAMLDIEDAYGYSKLPLILLDPSSSVKKTKSIKYDDWFD